jgi:hemerythrin-like metal-binding protein
VSIAVWGKRYETGIEPIDTQHKQLFQAINGLAAAMEAGVQTVQAQQSLEFLLSYTGEHFVAEEKFMASIGYPDLPAHQAEHAQLTATATMLREKLEAGLPVTFNLSRFLADWLKHHINDVDMGYVTYYRAQQKP